MQKSSNNGFIYVATVHEKFLKGAIYSAVSLKDYWPDANITLFTQPDMYSPELEQVFDNVNAECPQHIRSKMWALDKTPYDLTVYLDADTEIVHEDVRYFHDQMSDTADIMMTKIRPYNGKISKFPGGEMVDHGGVFMYNSKPHTLEFMKQWWELYKRQASGEWKWDTELYPEELRPWDQWSFWWLQNKTDYRIVREYLPDDARWNFVDGYRADETDKPIVVEHHTLPRIY